MDVSSARYDAWASRPAPHGMHVHTTSHDSRDSPSVVPYTHRVPVVPRASRPFPVTRRLSIHGVVDRDARVSRAVSRDARGETRGCEQTTDVERVLGLRRRARGERGGNEREGDGGWETRPTGVNVRGTRARDGGGDAMREG